MEQRKLPELERDILNEEGSVHQEDIVSLKSCKICEAKVGRMEGETKSTVMVGGFRAPFSTVLNNYTESQEECERTTLSTDRTEAVIFFFVVVGPEPRAFAQSYIHEMLNF